MAHPQTLQQAPWSTWIQTRAPSHMDTPELSVGCFKSSHRGDRAETKHPECFLNEPGLGTAPLLPGESGLRASIWFLAIWFQQVTPSPCCCLRSKPGHGQHRLAPSASQPPQTC